MINLLRQLDIIDTLIKGKQYFSHSGSEYDLRIVVSILLCLPGIYINRKKFLPALVIFFIIYEIVYIVRTTSVIGKPA